MMNAGAPTFDVTSIRAQLDRARSATVHAGDATGSSATINLIVFVDDPAHHDWVLERACKVADKHPSRTIILDASSSKTDAMVENACQVGDGGRTTTTVRSERVELPVSGLQPAAMASLVNALTLPDLPVVLWWTAKHVTTDPRFSPLATHVNGVVVDASGTVRDGRTLPGLARFFDLHSGTSLRDLAWMRLAPWRDIIARFFDDRSLREELFAIREVKIASGSDAEALYLAGWLGSRLGWNVQSPCRFSDRNGDGIALDVTRSGDMRRVSSVEILTGGSRYLAELTHDPHVVSLSVAGERAHEPALATLSAIDNASLIERAILEPSTDEIFETSLRVVSELVA